MPQHVQRPPRTPPRGNPPRPDRLALLTSMLEGTHRGGVPIRRQFLRTDAKGPDGTRAGMLAKLIRDENALNAFLLIHSVASSSAPYDALYPVATWAQIAGLDLAATLAAAKTRWAKVTSKLVKLELIVRDRDHNQMKYLLMHESGNGQPYSRPKNTGHGNWFSIPHIYWLGGFDLTLTVPEKAMLFILFDQLDDWVMPTDLAPAWYGISEATARKGFRGLEARGIISRRIESAPAPKSPTGWKQVFHYTTLGPWSIDARTKAMANSGPTRTVSFPTAAEQGSEA